VGNAGDFHYHPFFRIGLVTLAYSHIYRQPPMPNSQNPGSFTSSPIANAFAGLLTLAVAMGIGRFAFTPVLPMMLQDGSIAIADGGLLASANYLGYLIGALIAIAVRIRPEAAIRGGLAAIGLATLAMALPVPFEIWLLLRLLAGIASAWVLISVSAWSLESLAGYRRPILNSIVFAGVGIGIMTAGLVCIVLIHGNAGASLAWITLGVLSAILTAGIWPFFRRHAAAPSDGSANGRSKVRWNAESARLVLCYGAFGFGYIIPATFLPVMAKNVLQDSTLFGWSWPVFGLAGALSVLAVAPLSRHVGNRRLWIVSHIVMGIGIALPAWWHHAIAVFIAALCVGGTFMVITLVALQEAKRIAGRDASGLIAAMTAAFAAGQIAGPLSITFGFGGNLSIALLVAAFVLVASAFLLASKANPTPVSD
jgi:MFS family permease